MSLKVHGEIDDLEKRTNEFTRGSSWIKHHFLSNGAIDAAKDEDVKKDMKTVL